MNEVLGLIADVIGIVGAIGGLFAWYYARRIDQRMKQEERRLNENIRIILKNGGRTIELPASIRRRDLSRAELLGRIGMIKPEQRFQLSSLNTKKFFDDLDAVVNGTGQVALTISLTDGDFQQFQPAKKTEAGD